MNLYTVTAKSKDDHGYQLNLICEEIELEDKFDDHINKMGWEHYLYKITEYKLMVEDFETENSTFHQ